LSVPLASDEKHEMLEAYGAWGEKSMYGRTFEGIFRTTVLIGADAQDESIGLLQPESPLVGLPVADGVIPA